MAEIDNVYYNLHPHTVSPCTNCRLPACVDDTDAAVFGLTVADCPLPRGKDGNPLGGRMSAADRRMAAMQAVAEACRADGRHWIMLAEAAKVANVRPFRVRVWADMPTTPYRLVLRRVGNRMRATVEAIAREAQNERNQ